MSVYYLTMQRPGLVGITVRYYTSIHGLAFGNTVSVLHASHDYHRLMGTPEDLCENNKRGLQVVHAASYQLNSQLKQDRSLV